ncbi:hypothetical protein Tco_0157277 [Tanacetum coccineum]
MESVGSSPSLVILSDTEAEVMAIPASDLEVDPSKAPPSPDYVPSSPIHEPTSPDYHLGSKTESEPFEDESEPIKDAPKAVEPLPAQVAPPPPPVQILLTLPTSSTEHASIRPSRKRCRSPPPTSVVPPPDVPLPHRRSSLPPPDTTAETAITKFFIPEATTIVAPVRCCRMIEARRWTFARDDIDTWRHQDGEPRYEMEEGSSA